MIFPNELRVFISPKDIFSGSPGTGDDCPVANSISRKFPDNYVNVGYDYIRIYKDTDCEKLLRCYRVPKELRQKIKNYDESSIFNCGWVEAK